MASLPSATAVAASSSSLDSADAKATRKRAASDSGDSITQNSSKRQNAQGAAGQPSLTVSRMTPPERVRRACERSWELHEQNLRIRVVLPASGMRAKEKVWLWLVTSKLLLDRITSDIESIVHIRDWITRTLCTPAERTRIDASQRHSAPAERELLHELRHDREVSPDLVASLDSSVSWTASDTLLISLYREWCVANPRFAPRPPLPRLMPFADADLPSRMLPINTTFATLGDIYVYWRRKQKGQSDEDFAVLTARLARSLRHRIAALRRDAAKGHATVKHWSSAGVVSSSLPIPARRKHIIWFATELPLENLSADIERSREQPVEGAQHYPELMAPFLTLWLRARRTGANLPQGGWVDEDRMIVSEVTFGMCDFALSYRDFFSVTVASISDLYLLLYTSDGCAASLPPTVRTFFNLTERDRSALTLDELKRYDVVVLPSLHSLKVDVADFSETVSEIRQCLARKGIETWPSAALEERYDAKDAFYRAFSRWSGFEEHSLPTQIVRFDDTTEVRVLTQRLTLAMQDVTVASRRLRMDVAPNLFAFKPSEGFAQRGFQIGTAADVASMIEKAQLLRPALKGAGYLLQPFSHDLIDEYRVFLQPFTGEIECVIGSSFLHNGEGTIIFEDLTAAALLADRDRDIAAHPLSSLSLFVERLLVDCVPVQQQVREGIITRVDCFIDKSGRVLLNELTTGLDVSLFYAHRAYSAIHRHSERIFWQVARLAFSQS